MRCILTIFFMCIILANIAMAQESMSPKRIGIIGTTTSHVPAFTKLINNPNGDELMQRYQVTAAYAGGMPDNPSSWDRVEQYRKELTDMGITFYPTIEEMLKHVDFVLLESVDGRPHLEQAKPVIAAGKPMYIDKPVAGSLADAIEIFRLAKEKNVPIFSASSLRYVSNVQKIRNEQPHGKILGCESYSPCTYNEKHPDFYWYGIHGVETLFTVMGTGCQTVTRVHTDGTDVAVGVWKDGRIGSFRGIRQGKTDYGARIFCEKAVAEAGAYEGYGALVKEICTFFDTLKVPVDPQETLEIFAFMSAADISRANGGSPVTLSEAIHQAKAEMPVYVNIMIKNDNAKQVSFDGTLIAMDQIGKQIDAIKSKQKNAVVKVILRSEKGVDFAVVKAVTDQLGNAYLANYLYE